MPNNIAAIMPVVIAAGANSPRRKGRNMFTKGNNPNSPGGYKPGKGKGKLGAQPNKQSPAPHRVALKKAAARGKGGANKGR